MIIMATPPSRPQLSNVTIEERNYMKQLKSNGYSLMDIAVITGRSLSTVKRNLRKNEAS